MENINKTQIVKDFKEKSVLISREFKAPLADVWRAYTESKFLDQWWGPAPWHAETKSMDFMVGGFWLYAMVSPQGDKHWGIMNYVTIDHNKSFKLVDAFCDENGNINKELPVSNGCIEFSVTQNGTRVDFKTIYPTESDLQTIVKMGFEQGISICLDQLENIFNQNKM